MDANRLSAVAFGVGMILTISSAGQMACAVEPPIPARSEEARPAPDVAKGNNQFAGDIYGHIKDKTPGNLFLSPYSISTALAMTYAGSADETQRQMAEVLHFTGPEPELHQAMARLQQSLGVEKTKGYELRVANRLWGQKGYEFLSGFLMTTRQQYGAELGVLDFAEHTEAARQEINTWVERQTKNKIRELLPPGVIEARTKLVLTNAIYFKGKWQEQFEKQATKDTPFHLSADKEVAVPMMHQVNPFGYRAIDDLQVLEMPYADGELSMIVLLPKEIEGLAELEKKLTQENIEQWTKGLRRQNVIAFVPRFTMTSEFSLKDTLQAMGMTLAFDAKKADFSRMSRGEGLYISAVVHKAFADVNEEGTEAAAATGVVMAPRSAPVRPEQPPVFRADHPFVFLIRHNPTGSILFMGRVVNPRD
jgi:serpin B